MYAIDSIEIIGLTPEAVGKQDPSATTRSFTSQVSPSGLSAEIYGEPPIRALPMMCRAASASRAGAAPSARTSFMKVSRFPCFPGW